VGFDRVDVGLIVYQIQCDALHALSVVEDDEFHLHDTLLS